MSLKNDLEKMSEEMDEPKPRYVLLEKVKALYTALHPQLNQFPKSEKFTLRAAIENSMLAIIKLLIMQNYRQTDGERKELMLEVMAEAHLLSTLLQQALIFKYISYKHYGTISGLMKEIIAMAAARHRNLSGGGGKMKTNDNLYDEIIALPNLYHAYYEAKKGKVLGRRFLTFNKNLHENLWQLHEELLNQSYEFSPYTVFHVSDYKTRRIMAPHFRDHTVHHAIYNYLEPIYESTFIYDSFACRKGKGTHKAFIRSRKFLNKYGGEDYFMKCDVTKYFYSIDHYKLMGLLERKIKDERLLWLLGRVIDSHNEETLPHHIANPEHEEQRKGIPIGNLTSQLFANIYLNEMDQFIKHKLKVRHYVRYVDDFIILARDKNYLHEIWQKIRNFLANELYLKLEPRKTHINKISFGVDFAGYVAFKRYTRVRTRNYRRFMNNLRERIFLYKTGRLPAEKLYASFVSYMGHLGHTDSERLKENLFALYKNTFHGSVVEGPLPISNSCYKQLNTSKQVL